jgi:hypothetical protein
VYKIVARLIINANKPGFLETSDLLLASFSDGGGGVSRAGAVDTVLYGNDVDGCDGAVEIVL